MPYFFFSELGALLKPFQPVFWDGLSLTSLIAHIFDHSKALIYAVGIDHTIAHDVKVFNPVALKFAIPAALIFALPCFFIKSLRDPERPLLPLIMAFYTQTLAFSVYFVIFRSQESFRLPQATIMQSGLAVTLVLCFISTAIKGRFEFRRLPITRPVLAMTAAILLSFVFSRFTTKDHIPAFMTSLRDFTQYFFVIVNFYILVNFFNGRRHIWYFAAVVIIIMALEALIGIAQLRGFNEYIGLAGNRDPFSTLGNKNYVAEMLAMTLPFALAAAIAADKIWKKALIWTAIQLILIIILLAVTRGSWIGAIGSIIVFTFFAFDRLNRNKLIEASLSLIALALSACFWAAISTAEKFLPQPPIPYSSRFMSILNIMEDVLRKSPSMWLAFAVATAVSIAAALLILRTRRARVFSAASILAIMAAIGITITPSLSDKNKETKIDQIQKQAELAPPIMLDDSIASRTYIWGGSVTMIKHYPFGVGVGNFKIHYLDMLKAYLKDKNIKAIPGFFKDVNAKEAHNEYLHVCAELGPLGVLALVFFGITVTLFFHRTYYAAEDPMIQLLALGSFAGLTAMALSATLGFPFHIIGSSMLAGVLLAILVYCHDHAFNIPALPPVKKAPAAQPIPKKKHAAPQPPALQNIHDDHSIEKQWFYPKITTATGLALIVIVIIFACVVSVYSYQWQAANILIKDAQYSGQMGDVDNAALLFDQSLKLDPYNGDIHLFRGMYFQKIKDNDTALAEFLEAQKYYDLPQITLDLGAIYFEKGEDYYDQAENAFRDSLAIYPNYPLPRYNIGLIYYQRAINLAKQLTTETGSKDISIPTGISDSDRKNAISFLIEANNMFTQALKIQPGLDAAAFKMALSFERLAQLDPVVYPPDKAIEWYRKTIAINPSHSDAYYNLGLLLTRYASELNTRADKAARSGNHSLSNALSASATYFMKMSSGLFNDAINANSGNVRALNNQGNLLFANHKYSQAIDMYKKALAVDPGYVNARLNLALAYLNTDQCQLAYPYLSSLNSDATIDPQFEIKATYMTSVCLQKDGKLSEALSTIKIKIDKYAGTALSTTSEYISAVSSYATILGQTGNHSQAISLFNNLRATQKLTGLQDSEILYQLGGTAAGARSFAEAEKAYSTLIDLYPSSKYASQARPTLERIRQITRATRSQRQMAPPPQRPAATHPQQAQPSAQP